MSKPLTESELLAHFPGRRERNRNGWKVMAHCHHDANPSLSILPLSNGGWGLTCFACRTGDRRADVERILESAGLIWADINPSKGGDGVWREVSW